MLILPLLLLIPTLFSAVNAAAYGDNCPPTTCGNIKISYPFYLIPTSPPISTSFCGYLGLGLTCYNNNTADPTPILTLPNNSTYVVKNIDYISRAVTLIDSDVVLKTSNSNCLRIYNNLTIDETYPLTNHRNYQNLVFYFDCVVANESIPAINCLTKVIDGVSMKSYVFVAGREPVGVDWGEVCVEKVMTPAVVEESVEIGDLVQRFEEMMRLGFMLDWGVKRVDCDQCEKSGGMCGFRRAEENAGAVVDEFVCYCEDGGFSKLKCKRGKFSLPESLEF